MLPAVTFNQILERADFLGQGRVLRDRLVSIVFANPMSPIWRDLQGNRAFLDERTGNDWDLFFAGLSGYGPMRNDNGSFKLEIGGSKHSPFVGYYNPVYFTEIAHTVEIGHRQALEEAHGVEQQQWRYSGGTDLVSFMVYGSGPDWHSLKSVPLYDPRGDRTSLTHVVEGLARWQEEILNPQLAPGEVMYGTSQESALLTAALGWTASTLAGGLLSNAAYDLLRMVIE